MTIEAMTVTVGGLSLRGQSWTGGDLTALLIHEPGADHDLDDWNPVIPFLLGASCTVMAMDLRGHGASDGEWSASTLVSDLEAFIAAARLRSATLVVCAAGESAIAAIKASESVKVDGLVILSPTEPSGDAPRGAGAPKLILAGANDALSRDVAGRLRKASIGAAMTVSVPTGDHGAALLSGELAITCREQILSFINERRLEPKGGPVAPNRSDVLARTMGIQSKGAEA